MKCALRVGKIIALRISGLRVASCRLGWGSYPINKSQISEPDSQRRSSQGIGRFMARLNRTYLTWSGLLTCTLAMGCGGDGGGDGGTPPPPTTTIAKTDGDGQSGIVGQPLANPLEVLVTEDGTASSGTTVTWSTTDLNGSLDPTSAVTDANGIARSAWTLGTISGAQTARATVSGASGSPATFTASAATGPPSQIVKAAGDQQTGQTGTQLGAAVQARVLDAFSNGVPGVPVAWAASGATVSAASVPSDASGISGVNVTLGDTPGPITITATAGALIGSPLTFTATATGAPSGGQTIQVGNGQGDGTANAVFNPSSVTISVGETVTWVWNSGTTSHNVTTSNGSPNIPSTPSQTRATPFTFGPVTFTVAGTYTFYCSVHAGPTDPLGPGRMVGQITVQ